MARASARFRISVKDHQTSSTLKVELIEGKRSRQEHRYRLRVNGRESEHVREANLTYVFDRLRRWLVRRAANPKRWTHDRELAESWERFEPLP